MTEVTIMLTSDEALVLFDLLHRWEDLDAIDTVLMPGEQTALWALSGRLGSILVEPFEANRPSGPGSAVRGSVRG